MASDRGLSFGLVAAQTLGVLWLGLLGYRRGNHWVSASFISAAGWAVLFLAPCWIYAINPGLLKTTTTLAQPIALVDLSLFSLIAGVLIVRARRGVPDPPARIEVVDVPEPSRRALIGFAVFGVGCLLILMARNGGPVAYVSNQYRSGQLNGGLFYLVWGVLFLRYAPLVAVSSRWARGLPAGRPLLVYLVLGSSVVVVMGAREFLASAAVEVLLAAALLRRRPRLRMVLVPGALIGVVLVFGLGAVKFSQGYNSAHPGHHRSLPDYLVHVAPRTAIDDYANNYADGVDLIGLARRIVPAQANYEFGKAFLMLLLKPIPSGFRPVIRQARPIAAAFGSSGGFVEAEPLQATAYLQFGVVGIVVVFALLGAAIAAIDERLARAKRNGLTRLLPLMTLAAQVPVMLRGGIPAGFVFLAIDVLGVWITAVVVLGGTAGVRERISSGPIGWLRRR